MVGLRQMIDLLCYICFMDSSKDNKRCAFLSQKNVHDDDILLLQTEIVFSRRSKRIHDDGCHKVNFVKNMQLKKSGKKGMIHHSHDSCHSLIHCLLYSLVSRYLQDIHPTSISRWSVKLKSSQNQKLAKVRRLTKIRKRTVTL